MFSRSLREPEAWSAAVKKKRSVFVAAGRTTGAASSVGLSRSRSGLAGGGTGADVFVGAALGRPGGGIYGLSTPSATGLPYVGLDIKDEVTPGG